MRGVLGAGPNRMNVYTVRQATEGLADSIEEAGQAAKDCGGCDFYDSQIIHRIRHGSCSWSWAVTPRAAA